MISRRGLITGLVSFVAAPAIVKVSSLMPVKNYVEDVEWIKREVYEYIFPLIRRNYPILIATVSDGYIIANEVQPMTGALDGYDGNNSNLTA